MVKRDRLLRPRSAGSIFRWTALVSWYAVISVLHLKLTELVTSPLAFLGSRATVSTYSARLMALLGAALGIWLVTGAARGALRLRLAAAWTCWAAATAGACALLVCTPNELAHIPQYAVLAVLLARCADPGCRGAGCGRLLFWVAVLGVGDEVIQYFFLRNPHSTYFDWNDTALNILGGAAGLLLRYGEPCQNGGACRRPGSQRQQAGPAARPEILFVTAGAACAAALWLAGTLRLAATTAIPPGGMLHQAGRPVLFLERKPGISGSWQRRGRSGRYYVMSTGNALLVLPLLLAGLSLAVSAPGRRREGKKTF